MTENSLFPTLTLSKEESLKIIEKKIICGRNAEKKLKSLKISFEDNINNVKEHMEEFFNKQRTLLNEQENRLIKKLNVYQHHQNIKIKKEMKKLQEILDVLHTYQCCLEIDEPLSDQAYHDIFDDYISCLTVPRFKFLVKNDLQPVIKEFGSMKPTEIMMLNLDLFNDEEEVICLTCTQSKNLPLFEPTEEFELGYFSPNSDDFEVLDNVDDHASNVSSSISFCPENENEDLSTECIEDEMRPPNEPASSQKVYRNHLSADFSFYDNENMNKTTKASSNPFLEQSVLSPKSNTEMDNKKKKQLSRLIEMIEQLEERKQKQLMEKENIIKENDLINCNEKDSTVDNEGKLEKKKEKENVLPQKEEKQSKIKQTDLTLKHVNVFNEKVKNILGSYNRKSNVKKECFAQKEIDAFCSKIILH